MNKGIIKFIKFVIRNFINSFIPPCIIDNLKIIFLDKKYETMTPIEKAKKLVKYVRFGISTA